MSVFTLYAGQQYYAAGGAKDLVGHFDSKAKAIAAAEKALWYSPETYQPADRDLHHVDWAQVTNGDGRIVWSKGEAHDGTDVDAAKVREALRRLGHDVHEEIG